jgi:hypothetical protein
MYDINDIKNHIGPILVKGPVYLVVKKEKRKGIKVGKLITVDRDKKTK